MGWPETAEIGLFGANPKPQLKNYGKLPDSEQIILICF
jgi:hypothetical protein